MTLQDLVGKTVVVETVFTKRYDGDWMPEMLVLREADGSRVTVVADYERSFGLESEVDVAPQLSDFIYTNRLKP